MDDQEYMYDEQEEPMDDYVEEEPRRPQRAIISTNLTVNLICTLCSMLGILGVFFFFAEKRSQAVRRYAVQSTGLFFVVAVITVVLWVLALIFGAIPVFGMVFGGLMRLLMFGVFALNVVGRIRMMFSAYRGEAYVLPLIGAHLRQFE